MEELPVEVQEAILCRLSWPERIEAAGVCRLWSALVNRLFRRTHHLCLQGLDSLVSGRQDRVYLSEILCRLSHLRHLHFARLDLQSPALPALALQGLRFQRLSVLEIQDCLLDYASFRAFLDVFVWPACRLQELNWRRNVIRPAPLPPVRRRKLGTVSAPPPFIDDEDVEPVPAPPHIALVAALPPTLTSLELNALALSDVPTGGLENVGDSLERLCGRLPRLRRLSLADSPSRLRRRHLAAALRLLPALQELDLGPGAVGGRSIAGLLDDRLLAAAVEGCPNLRLLRGGWSSKAISQSAQTHFAAHKPNLRLLRDPSTGHGVAQD